MIRLRNVTKEFLPGDFRRTRPVPAVENISFSVARGEFVAVVGRSGCGKSTLLNLIAGLLRPERGAVLYDDQPVTAVNTRVGYMTQRDNLLPWRNVWGNVALPLQIHHRSPAAQRQSIGQALEQVGLLEFSRYFPSQLSGGMRQRVALARLLIYDPETLLMDEPFGALDEQSKLDLQDALLRLWDERRKTVIFVTHDLAEAVTLADRVYVLGGQPGTLRKTFQVPLGRPRHVHGLRFDPVFLELYRALWDAVGHPDVEGVGGDAP